MSHLNEGIVRRLYAARARGDQVEARSLLAPTVRWRDPYPPPYGGTFEGVDEVIGFLFGPLVHELDDAGLDLHDVIANDRHTVALVSWWAVLEGRRIEGHEIGVYHLKDGRITEVWFTTEDQAAADAFFRRARPV